MWHSTQERYRHTAGIWVWCPVFLVRLSVCPFLGLLSLCVALGLNPWGLQLPLLSQLEVGPHSSAKILRSIAVNTRDEISQYYGPFCRLKVVLDSLTVAASPFLILTGRGAEPNGKILVKAPLQAGGLPGTAAPSTGGRASPAVDNHPFPKTVAARKRKGVEEEEQKAELWPANKQAKVERNGEKAQSPHQSRGGVPAPAAHPGPAPAPTGRFRTSRQRGKKMLQLSW